MSLYRKYRPESLEQMVGNESELASLERVLKKENKPHTFLLTGPSGCGKTTIARIAARMVGGEETSITEINSADNRGIDTARDIIDQMRYIQPMGGARVYIIDEFHQVSKPAQEALLKPLEDTPEHVFFFICTTNPGKIIPAIKTRCTQVKVQSLSNDMIYRIVRRIAKKEGFELSKDILEELADNSLGSPRTALVLLEKISELDDEKQMREIIALGEEADTQVIELCRALLKGGSWGNITPLLLGLKDYDIEKIRWAVLGYMNAVLSKSNNGHAAATIYAFSEPFYDTGRAGLTLACHDSISGGK